MYSTLFSKYPAGIVALTLILLLCFGLSGQSYGQAVGSDESVQVEVKREKNRLHVTAINSNPFTVTLILDASGKNYSVPERLPVTRVLEPNSKGRILTVSVDQTAVAFSFNTSYKWHMGDAQARHDDSYVYRLPYQHGSSHRIGQGFAGTFSHTGRSNYAVDFIMPEGTRIYAAREGIVVQLREDSNQGGPEDRYKNESNFVIIEHPDGTYGEYAHLKRQGVMVHLGQRVSRGQFIGLSGNTGYSSGPHLHFMVTRVSSNGRFNSLPVSFQTRKGVVDKLVEGEVYTAGH